MLGVFAKYSPEYPCLLNGLTRFDPMISQAFGARRQPGAEPEHHRQPAAAQPLRARRPAGYAAKSGPDCRGLTNIDAIIAAAKHGEYYCPAPAPDGVHSADNPTGQPALPRRQRPERRPPGRGEPELAAGQSLPFSLAGSTAELDFVRNILGYQTGIEPRKVSDLAATTMAPLLRGTQVMLPMKGSLRGMAGPLVKLIIFALVTIMASYVLISTITNAGLRRHQVTYRRPVHRRRRAWSRATRCASPACGSARSPASGWRRRSKDRPVAVVELQVRRSVPVPRSVQATIRYRNLVGQRYIALTEAPGSGGAHAAGRRR